MITKESLQNIMCEWVKPIIDNVESLRGCWSHSSFAGGFCWDLGDGVGRRYRAIGTNICYDNEKVIVGYDIWTGGPENVNIKIRENSIEFIEAPNFQGFSKEEIEDLYDVLKNHIMY